MDDEQPGKPLRTGAVADRTGIPASTLRYWRFRGRGEGPPSYKLGNSVVYDPDELMAWWNEQRRTTSTAEGSASA